VPMPLHMPVQMPQSGWYQDPQNSTGSSVYVPPALRGSHHTTSTPATFSSSAAAASSNMQEASQQRTLLQTTIQSTSALHSSSSSSSSSSRAPRRGLIEFDSASSSDSGRPTSTRTLSRQAFLPLVSSSSSSSSSSSRDRAGAFQKRSSSPRAQDHSIKRTCSTSSDGPHKSQPHQGATTLSASQLSNAKSLTCQFFQLRNRRPTFSFSKGSQRDSFKFFCKLTYGREQPTWIGEGFGSTKKESEKLACVDFLRIAAPNLFEELHSASEIAPVEVPKQGVVPPAIEHFSMIPPSAMGYVFGKDLASRSPKMVLNNWCYANSAQAKYTTIRVAGSSPPYSAYASFVTLSSNIAQPPAILWGWSHNKKEVEIQAAFHMLKFLEQHVGDNRTPVPSEQASRSRLFKSISLTAEQLDQVSRLVGDLDLQEPTAMSASRYHHPYRASSPMPKYSVNPDLAEQRVSLPVYSLRSEIVAAIDEHKVVMINGDTGTGKTTQVPQYILEEGMKRGIYPRILVVEPRRLAAVSVAERIAVERNERHCGLSVGYQVRFSSTQPTTPAFILLATIGVLLRKLQSDPLMNEYTHIIMDEPHERQANGDFLLNILKRLAVERDDIRIVLTSATMQQSLFEHYFAVPPTASILVPSKMYDVQEMFSDDLVSLIDTSSSYLHVHPRACVTIQDEKADIPYERIVQILEFIASHGTAGAVLVFLPGWEEIKKAQRALDAHPVHGIHSSNSSLHIRDSRSQQKPELWRTIPIHGKMNPSAQQAAFVRVPAGERKIVLSTNVAESSITIDDVVFVIDCGVEKAMNTSAASGMSFLCSVWISKASAMQRLGRAGRVCNGYCFRLYSSQQAALLPRYAIPEIQTRPIDDVVLLAKHLQLAECIESFMDQLIEPPPVFAVAHAVARLQALGALDEEKQISPLGSVLAGLPVPASVGKLLLFGLVFRITTPIIAIAARICERCPFSTNDEDRHEVNRVRTYYAGSSDSDLIGFWNMYQAYRDAINPRQFCEENRLYFDSMCRIDRLVNQLHSELTRLEFLPFAQSDAHAGNTELLLAVLGGVSCSDSLCEVTCGQKKSSLPKLTLLNGRRLVLNTSSVLSKQKSLHLTHRLISCGEIFTSASNAITRASLATPVSFSSIALLSGIVRSYQRHGTEEVDMYIANELFATMHLSVDLCRVQLRRALAAVMGNIAVDPHRIEAPAVDRTVDGCITFLLHSREATITSFVS